jgi:hypothetical protein
LILVIVVLQALIGYLGGVRNWSEYYTETVNINETTNNGVIALGPMDSLYIGVSFQGTANYPSLFLQTPNQFNACVNSGIAGCGSVAEASIMSAASKLQIYYTSTTGGAYIWVAIGVANGGNTILPGILTIRISRLYLVFIPVLGGLALMIDLRRKRRERKLNARET